MKHRLSTSTLFASLALAIPATAAPEAANPEAKDAPNPIEAQIEPKAADRAEGKAFLGLGSSEVPGFLGKHLKLKDGSGVLVRQLYPGGPAEKAGIAVDDVITEAGGKAVGSHQDLVDQITARKPGGELELKFIHEGDAHSATAKLGEFPAELAQDADVPEAEAGIEMFGMGADLPPEIQKQLREAMQHGLKGMRRGNLNLLPGMGRVEIHPGGLGQVPDAGGLGQVPDDDGDGALPGKPGISFKMASKVSLMDDEGIIEMSDNGDGSEVKVRDKAGKEVWSGPWDTEQDKAAAPPEIRERIERLNINVAPGMGGLRLHAIPGGRPEAKGAGDKEAPTGPAKP
jgi:hypothetical protein